MTAAAQEPKREFRSVWLTTYQLIDWPSSSARGNEEKCKAELLEYLDNHEKRNYTGVCLHVRTWADAVYKSSYEPWSEWVSGTRGKDPGWDPLAFAVEECHKRGLECYAWVNPFRFSRNWQARTTPQDLEVLSKGWIIDNGTTTQHNEYQIFNPALPEVREYLYGIMKEIYTNYRIDGFLFDDYFYPNKIPADNTAQDYADFQEQNPGVSGTKENINNWRRGNINLFMRELYAMVQKDRPDIRFGLSPPAWQRKVAPISRVSTLCPSAPTGSTTTSAPTLWHGSPTAPATSYRRKYTGSPAPTATPTPQLLHIPNCANGGAIRQPASVATSTPAWLPPAWVKALATTTNSTGATFLTR